MDDIAATAGLLSQAGIHHPTTACFPQLVKQLEGAPRFLFDEAAIDTAVELTLGRPKIMLDSLVNVRIPYPIMWVEWPESGRVRLREEFEGLISDERPLPKRVGFLLETDESGRRGTATWVWNGGFGNYTPPNVAPVSPFFDLDRKFDQPLNRVEDFQRGNLPQVWRGNPVQEAALLEIWRTAAHQLSPWGEQYFAWMQQRLDDNAIASRLSHLYADVYGEYIMIWAIVLMLTSSRRIVDYRPIDRNKLNRNRVKRRQAPLLNHTEVVLRIGEENVIGQRRQPLGYKR
jgi:hypothetical protein